MKKIRDLSIFLLIYLFAYVGAYFAAHYLPIDSMIIKTLIFDVIATVIVYIFGVIFKNSSVYDPYWSVLPGLIAINLFIYYKAFTPMHIIVLCAVLFWSIRLTVNWIIVTSGFSYEDWRYRYYRNKANGNKLLWFILNFFGIHLIPTLFVFLGMLPLFDIFKLESLNLFTVIGVVIILLGTLFEILADSSMHRHRDSKVGGLCLKGLWKYSRHPNYLGEMTIWFGIFICMIVNIQTHFYFGIGFIGIVFMFNIISIPLIEKHLLLPKHPEYKEYQKKVSRFLLLPNKK